MLRMKAIPRARRAKPVRWLITAQNRADIIFWLVVVLAVAVGGMRAVSGFPALAGVLVPSGLMEAEAGPVEPVAHLVIPLSATHTTSRFAPAVLTPVASRGYPAWLTARIRFARDWSVDADAAVPARNPVIAIVIDDLGTNPDATRRAIALPKAVTLSFLPYPQGTPALARAASRAGHEVLVHVPMEPVGHEDPGPMALTTNLNAHQIVQRLNWALARVPGHDGINNHMGSKFTADARGLVPVMETLADKRLFFFDSVTSPRSVVIKLAHAFGVASEGRDVFLDDVETTDAVEVQLAELAAIARHEGVAIAIGHPHDVTLDVLAGWIAKAKAHGLTLVPVSEAIRLKTRREALKQLAAK